MTLRRRRGAWLLALLAVVVVAGLSFASARRYVASQAAVHHTMAVREAATETFSLLKDAETGGRGFLLTNDPQFLAPYTVAVGALRGHIARLRRLTQDDPAQAREVLAIEHLAAAKLDRLEQTIALRRNGQTEQALAMVREGSGRRLMEALRAQISRMLAREAARLAQRERAAEDGQRQATIALVLSLAVAVAIVLGGWTTARRDLAEARRNADRMRESEKAFRALADNASDLVRILAADGKTLYVSPSCERLLGFSVAEMLALKPGDLLHESDRSALVSLAQRVRDTGSSPDLILHRLRARDGEYRWFETRIDQAPHQSELGAVHLISRDVTARKLAQDTLRTQTTHLESILASMGDGVVVLDAERRLIKVNPVARAYIRQDEGEIVSKDWSKHHRTYLLDGVTPFPSEQGPLTRALNGEASDAVELMIQDRANVLRAFSVTARPLDDNGRAVGCVAIYRDISAQLRSAKELLESEQRCRIIADSSFEGVAITQTGIVIDANANLANSLSRAQSDLVGSVTLDLFAAEDRDLVDEMISESEALFEARLLRADGTPFPAEVRGRLATFRGEPVRIVAVRDITEKRAREAELKRQSEQLRALSLRDELTGLYNRRGFLEHAQQLLLTAARGERAACLFFVDLNAMKAINDGLGHEAGDRALVATAIVLTSVFRESDIIARLGGDEFAIFAPDCGAADVANVCARLDDAVAAYNDASGESFRLSMSVGASVYAPQDKLSLETLMARADAQMYAIKEANARNSPAPPRSGSGRVLAARPSERSSVSSTTTRQASLPPDGLASVTRSVTPKDR